MPSDPDKTKRWRPSWSVRMLLIVVTLVCAYLACWRATAIHGVEAVESDATGKFASSPMPFVVYCAEFSDAGGSSEVYYLWCFAKPKKLSERFYDIQDTVGARLPSAHRPPKPPEDMTDAEWAKWLDSTYPTDESGNLRPMPRGLP